MEVHTGSGYRRPPVYNLQYQGIPAPVPNHPHHFGVGRGYIGRHRGINKALKPILVRKRTDQRSTQVFSPVRKSAQKIMQSQTQVQESVQEKSEETVSHKERSAECIIKNGLETCSSLEENPKEVSVLKIEDGSTEVGDKNSDCNDPEGVNENKPATAEENADKIQPKLKSVTIKDKKVKKSATAKVSPKGKHSPRSKKESKPENEEEVEATDKETEKLQDEKVESELKSHESASLPNFQPSTEITHLISPLPETSVMNDCVVEIPHQDEDKSNESPPTSAEESSSKLLVTYSVKDSPRRSTRLATHLSYPKQRSPAKPDSSSIIVLDSDSSISVLELSQNSQGKSFAQSLRSISGRPSLRPLPVYNRSFNRQSTIGSASIHSNLSSRSETTTGNDSESDSQETKILRPRSGLWGLFHTSSRTAPSQDYATDNEESTNRSLADDSGNDSEMTDLPEAPSSLSFGKRKSRDAGLVDDSEQNNKRIKSEVGQKNNASTSAGLFSIMSSPMNLFANKIRGDKGKSSTPLHMLKTSIIDEETRDDLSVHEDDVSEIEYEDEDPSNFSGKESLRDVSPRMGEEQEMAPRRWCSIM
ncbi:uncharacterized protein LOC110835445 isoform X2 [Zootermopsis nevadensis]|uniref:uncharacterized protein LOC110835445 isoform X2 n=1 Tax=Zootermopsis nevadensis TaxID=136037 RepID=UPI000B8EBDDA|nr:uncharacterized protein LOC110835445 isoform X2 [Zootermopsis nevadensis]